MYLNLDLLYNIDNYLFPLFYYQSCGYKSSYKVYSPMTKKFVYINRCYGIYYDLITKQKCLKEILYKRIIFDDTKYIFTENTIIHITSFYNKCNPFKLNSEDLYFLKNNIRIN